MKEESSNELVRRLLERFEDTDKLVKHIKDAKKANRSVLGALFNLLAEKAEMTPIVKGTEVALPPLVYCHPLSVVNLEMMLLEIERRKYRGFI